MRHSKGLKLPQKQRGYLMPMAMGIIVILGLLVATLARTTSQTAFSVVQEGVSLQSFYAAESGAQYAMNRLFYSAGTVLTKSDVDTRCAGVGTSVSFTEVGLNDCSVSVSCSAEATSTGGSLYTITSIGQCGGSGIDAERTIQVSAQME